MGDTVMEFGVMEMRSCRLAGVARPGDRLPVLHHVAGLHIAPAQMSVFGDVAVAMIDRNTLSVAGMMILAVLPARTNDLPASGCLDGSADRHRDIDAFVYRGLSRLRVHSRTVC